MERDVPHAGLQRLGMRGGPAITRGVRSDRQTGGAAGASRGGLGPFGRGAAAGAGRRVSAQRRAGGGLLGERVHRPGGGARPGRDHRLRGGDPRRGDGPLPCPRAGAVVRRRLPAAAQPALLLRRGAQLRAQPALRAHRQPPAARAGGAPVPRAGAVQAARRHRLALAPGPVLFPVRRHLHHGAVDAAGGLLAGHGAAALRGRLPQVRQPGGHVDQRGVETLLRRLRGAREAGGGAGAGAEGGRLLHPPGLDRARRAGQPLRQGARGDDRQLLPGRRAYHRHVALAGRAALRGRPGARPARRRRHEPDRVLWQTEREAEAK